MGGIHITIRNTRRMKGGKIEVKFLKSRIGFSCLHNKFESQNVLICKSLVEKDFSNKNRRQGKKQTTTFML